MKKLYYISFFLSFSIILPEGIVAQENGAQANVSGKPRVVCYTRTEIATKLGNALHLGYSEDGRHYVALNNDACVMALRKVDNEPGLSEEQKIAGVMKTLTAPYLFRMKEGGFGVVALRTDQNGISDISATGSFLFIKSCDLVHYEPERLCRLPVNEMLEAVSCEYDEAVGKYRVRWMIKREILPKSYGRLFPFLSDDSGLKAGRSTGKDFRRPIQLPQRPFRQFTCTDC